MVLLSLEQPNRIVINANKIVIGIVFIRLHITFGYFCRRAKNTKSFYLLKTLLIAEIFDKNFIPACRNTLLPAVLFSGILEFFAKLLSHFYLCFCQLVTVKFCYIIHFASRLDHS